MFVSPMVFQHWQPVHMASHYPKFQVLQLHFCAFPVNQQNDIVYMIFPGHIKQ